VQELRRRINLVVEQVRRAVNPSAAAARGYSYLAPGPIDEPNWAFALEVDEFPLTVISWGYSLKTAVSLLSVVRSIASEHKARMPPRSAAIIRRRMEAVTAAAPDHPPQPKAVFSPAADARNGCDQTISTPSTSAPPRRIIWLMLANVQVCLCGDVRVAATGQPKG
jgi:hypothetical protein